MAEHQLATQLRAVGINVMYIPLIALHQIHHQPKSYRPKSTRPQQQNKQAQSKQSKVKMQFSTALITTTLALLSTTSADGIFAINGTGTIGSPTIVTLQVLNGAVGSAPTCSGTAETAPLPASGTIPCDPGYALSYTWETVDGSIAATYTDPTNSFTYNVPNTGCGGDGPTCSFGFQDLFPGRRKSRSLRV